MSRSKKLPPPKMPPLETPKHGMGKLLRGGVPGNKGGGRKSLWLRDWCDELLADEKCKAQVQAVLCDKDHPAFDKMWSRVADRAHGRPPQAVELTGKDGGDITVRVVRD